MIMLEYPSRSNLNCFPEFYGAPAGGDEFFDPRKVSTPLPLEKTTIICGQQWTRTTPVRTCFTDRLPYPNDFCYPIFLLLKFKTFYCSNFRFLYPARRWN